MGKQTSGRRPQRTQSDDPNARGSSDSNMNMDKGMGAMMSAYGRMSMGEPKTKGSMPRKGILAGPLIKSRKGR